jgi:hypothetical protein
MMFGNTESFRVLATLSESLIRSAVNSLINDHPFHLQSTDDLGDHLFNAQVGAVDDVRVFGDDQRRDAARRIRQVAGQNLVALTLRHAPAQAHFRRRVNVKLAGRLGENDRADIAPFHHNISIVRAGPHLCDENFTHPRDTADEGHLRVHAILLEMFGGIDPIDENPGTVVPAFAIDPRSLEEARHGVSVTGIDRVPQDMPGYGAIHCAGVYVIETKLPRELACNAALAGRGRTVNRNNSVGRPKTHGVNMRVTQAVCLPGFILRSSTV